MMKIKDKLRNGVRNEFCLLDFGSIINMIPERIIIDRIEKRDFPQEETAFIVMV